MAAEKILKDKRGRKIGVIKYDQGKQVLYNALNRKLGTYDPKSNTTKDGVGHIIGKVICLKVCLKINTVNMCCLISILYTFE
ncbi:MAG: hypothetical protein ACI3XI_00870 [Eubacteriales bacterium]